LFLSKGEIFLISWCSQCHKYIGETKPIDDFSFTHGLCLDCRPETLDFLQDHNFFPRIDFLKNFYFHLRENCRLGHYKDAKGLLEQGLSMGIRPLDIVLGMMKPMLYEVGELWARNEMTVAQEHLFTSVCSSSLELLFEHCPEHLQFRQSDTPKVLLVAAENNYHILGLKMLELVLMLHQVPTYLVIPGLPPQDAVDLARQLAPKVVALSIAMGTQAQTLAQLGYLLTKIPEHQRPIFAVGGFYIRQHPEEKIPGIHLYPDIASFIKDLGRWIHMPPIRSSRHLHRS
jgi:methanogenic corrinoid protein MtbC1